MADSTKSNHNRVSEGQTQCIITHQGCIEGQADAGEGLCNRRQVKFESLFMCVWALGFQSVL